MDVSIYGLVYGIVLSFSFFCLGFLMRARRQKLPKTFEIGQIVRYSNKKGEIEEGVVVQGEDNDAKYIIIRKQSLKYSPLFVIKTSTITNVNE